MTLGPVLIRLYNAQACWSPPLYLKQRILVGFAIAPRSCAGEALRETAKSVTHSSRSRSKHSIAAG
jgi:hypothetical protein